MTRVRLRRRAARPRRGSPGSPPNCVCQSAWLRTTTGSPVESSGGEHAPDDARARRSAEELRRGARTVSSRRGSPRRRGSPPPARTPPSPANDARHALASRDSSPGESSLRPPSGRACQIFTRRSGSGTAAGAASTKSASENAAVFAPTPRATTRMAVSAKPGVRRSDARRVAQVLPQDVPVRRERVRHDVARPRASADRSGAERPACSRTRSAKTRARARRRTRRGSRRDRGAAARDRSASRGLRA